MSSRRVDGVVLCRVGPDRLAVACDDVDGIVEAEGPSLDVAAAFSGTAVGGEGRALLCAGQLLRVDSTDVVATPGLQVLPVPGAVGGAAGGALFGFVELGGALWPLVSAFELLRYLEGRVGAS